MSSKEDIKKNSTVEWFRSKRLIKDIGINSEDWISADDSKNDSTIKEFNKNTNKDTKRERKGPNKDIENKDPKMDAEKVDRVKMDPSHNAIQRELTKADSTSNKKVDQTKQYKNIKNDKLSTVAVKKVHVQKGGNEKSFYFSKNKSLVSSPDTIVKYAHIDEASATDFLNLVSVSNFINLESQDDNIFSHPNKTPTETSLTTENFISESEINVKALKKDLDEKDGNKKVNREHKLEVYEEDKSKESEKKKDGEKKEK